MAKERNITQEDFNALLAWLDPDRDAAGNRHEIIRRSLMKIFLWRGYCDAEDMADETVNRVARNVKKIAPTYVGDPSVYFYNVANKLMMEWARKKSLYVSLDEEGTKELSEEQIAVSDPEDSSEADYECLDHCLQLLKHDERALILSYYHEDKQAKIDHRKALASEMNLDVNALRVRVYRIRCRLEKCIENCLGEK